MVETNQSSLVVAPYDEQKGAVMRRCILILAFFSVLMTNHPVNAAHRCDEAATEQAKRLLAFHNGSAERIEIGKTVTALAPIRSPANRSQMFDVLEVQGFIYKAQYRLRLIYAQVPNTCVLMGQEVLELSSL